MSYRIYAGKLFMKFGRFYLIKNSSKPIQQDLTSSFLIVLSEKFSLASSHIQLIIPKGKSHLTALTTKNNQSINRVLLSCIKQLGQRPCPTCLVSKKNVQFLGTMDDTQTRRNKKRKDDKTYQSKISATREHIYLKGGLLNGKWLHDRLNAESLVPTQVCEIVKF